MFAGKRSYLKYMKRAGIYKSGSVTFNPNTMIATSYDWWQFVKVIDKAVIFNSYSYSVTTTRHQSLVQSLLSQLKIKVDYTIEAPRGLQNLHAAYDWANTRIASLQAAIDKPRTHAEKNAQRRAQIRCIEAERNLIQKLMNREAKAFRKSVA